MKRNMLKRIHRDMERLNELNVQFEYNEQADLIYDKFTITQMVAYPFNAPKLKIYDTEYIDFFIRKYDMYNKHIPFLKLKCPCCYNITCEWCPSYDLRRMFDEYIYYSLTYSKLFNFLICYKSEWFDDLVYNHILEYV